MTEHQQDQGNAGISRRRLTTGVAWSLPMISAVASAPALAASSTCPAATLEPRSYSSQTHSIRMTNTGSVPIPAGAVIVWVLADVSSLGRVVLSTVIGVTASTNVASIPAGQTATIRFTVDADIPPGGNVQWVYFTYLESYTSRATLVVSGTPSECVVNEGCISGGSTSSSSAQGTTCPSGT